LSNKSDNPAEQCYALVRMTGGKKG